MHREPDDGDVRLDDPKMPTHYIAQANREKLGITGMEKVVAFDQSNHSMISADGRGQHGNLRREKSSNLA